MEGENRKIGIADPGWSQFGGYVSKAMTKGSVVIQAS